MERVVSTVHLRERVYLVGIDIRKLDWHVKPDRFYQTAAWRWRHVVEPDEKFNLIVVDPPFSPWRRGQEKRTHYHIHNMLGDPYTIIKYGVEAARHYQAYLLIHLHKKYIPKGFKVLHEIYFQGLWRKHNNQAQIKPYQTYFTILKP